MAEGRVIVGLSYESAPGVDAFLEFDVLTDEAHTRAATATSHPVEDGANISDHIRSEPASIVFRAVVSNKPIRNIRNDTSVSGSQQSVSLRTKTSSRKLNNVFVLPGPIVRRAELSAQSDTTTRVSVFAFASEFDRVTAVYDELTRLLNTGTLCSVVTSLKTLDSMALVGVEVARDAARGQSLDARLTFSAIRVVSTSTVVVPQSVRSRNRGGQSTRDPDPAEEATATRTQSFFAGLLDAAS